MNTMKMAKVITFRTYENKNGLHVEATTTVPAEANPMDVFRAIGMEGLVKSYEVSTIMLLPIALTYSNQLMKKNHIG